MHVLFFLSFIFRRSFLFCFALGWYCLLPVPRSFCSYLSLAVYSSSDFRLSNGRVSAMRYCPGALQLWHDRMGISMLPLCPFVNAKAFRFTNQNQANRYFPFACITLELIPASSVRFASLVTRLVNMRTFSGAKPTITITCTSICTSPMIP